jgi:hypothetical protein
MARLHNWLIACLLTSESQGSGKPTFQEKAFWDRIYEKTNSSENDWFQQWRDPMITRKGGQTLADVIMPRLLSLGSGCTLRLLHIGCGTSNMPEQMLQDGFATQVCVDSSEVAMTARSEKFAVSDRSGDSVDLAVCDGAPSMQFLTLDAAKTGFEADSFDIILDKGTLDAQAGGPEGLREVAATLDEAVRLLSTNGLYVQISHSDKRSPLLDKNLDGTMRAWHAEQFANSTPVPVLAPIAYVKSARHKNTSSDERQEKPKKDRTYVYMYRKNAHWRYDL